MYYKASIPNIKLSRKKNVTTYKLLHLRSTLKELQKEKNVSTYVDKVTNNYVIIYKY